MCFGINKLLLGYSTTATAVFGAYFKLQTFVYMAVFGLNNALIPIVAFNYGARKGDRIKAAIRFCGIFSAVIGAVGTVIMELFPAQLIGAFSPSEEMYLLGITTLRILGLTFIFGSVTVMVSYALQGFSRGVSSLIVSAGRQVILLLPLAVLLGNIMGINGIWWSFLVAEVIDMVLAIIFLGIIEKKELTALEA
jgi:Na+-driven multidrug efflux pump